jgi:hypothetical protein
MGDASLPLAHQKAHTPVIIKGYNLIKEDFSSINL